LAPLKAEVAADLARSTLSWSAAFQNEGLVYAAPRVIYLALPMSHPGRGNSYSAKVGLVIDLSDVRAMDEILGQDARPVLAFIVAHEVGHHVQRLLAAAGSRPLLPPGPGRELQADCYAGWSLGQNNAAGLGAAEAAHEQSEFARQLGRALDVIGALEYGPYVRQDASAPTHGRFTERIWAANRGRSADGPFGC
jgi:predicted metalloprotease